jgi:hypothetical protein
MVVYRHPFTRLWSYQRLLEYNRYFRGWAGCPFAGHKGASGSVRTEDLVFLCEELGIQTGVSLDAQIDAARLAEKVVGHDLSGSVMKGGGLKALQWGVVQMIAVGPDPRLEAI